MIYSILINALFDSDDDADARARFREEVQEMELRFHSVPTAVLTRRDDDFSVVDSKLGNEWRDDIRIKESGT